MITCEVSGGLGNQLFQIFTVISYAFKLKQNFGFIYGELSNYNITNRRTYWNDFLKNLKKYTYTDFNKEHLVQQINIKENQFHYSDLPDETQYQQMPNLPYQLGLSLSLVSLMGYFQSYRYFHEYYDYFYKTLKIKKQKEKVMEKFNVYPKGQYPHTISMHFRLGDYKNLQEYHNILPYQYYENAVQFIISKIKEIQEAKEKNTSPPSSPSSSSDSTSPASEKLKVIYFCENHDFLEVHSIVKKLYEKFPDIMFIRASPSLEDWEQMLLMSCCRYNIIANSTFSWWGAYFNQDPHRMVCYPSVWFGPLNQKNITTDLFLPEWNRVSIDP